MIERVSPVARTGTWECTHTSSPVSSQWYHITQAAYQFPSPVRSRPSDNSSGDSLRPIYRRRPFFSPGLNLIEVWRAWRQMPATALPKSILTQPGVLPLRALASPCLRRILMSLGTVHHCLSLTARIMLHDPHQKHKQAQPKT